MGWSLDLVIMNIHHIFGNNLHEVTVPESAYPYIRINYEMEISLEQKKRIAELVPENWYIYFHPGTIHRDKEATLTKFPKP